MAEIAGPLIIEVTSAITISATNTRAPMAPFCSATDAITISIAPRALSPNATASASRAPSRARRAPAAPGVVPFGA